MTFREAQVKDIPQLQAVRISVKENPLPDPGLITPSDYEEFLFHRGKGWLCEIDNKVVGFAIVDLQENNIWALFIQPGFEGKGIGKRLQENMLDWYFSQTDQTVWLGTAPGTRAEKFYCRAGWKEKGIRSNGEIRFEMTIDEWRDKKMKQQISHIALVVKDYDEAIQFYTEKLKFSLIEDTRLSDTKRWVLVAPPGSSGCCLLLAKAVGGEQESRIGNQTGGRVFLFLYTDDLWRDYKKMKESGIIFSREPVAEEYGTVAVFKDLYGNLWDLIEPSKSFDK